MNLEFWNSIFSLWNFLKIYIFTDIYPNWKLLYTWIISKIIWKITSWSETIELQLLGLWSLLNFIYFKSWWNYNFSLNQDPATILKTIIDYFNTIYTWVWLNYGSNVIDYWSSVNQSFNYHTCFSSIKNTINSTDYWWSIRSNWELYYKPIPSSATHILTLNKDIDSITIEQDSEKITNKSIIDYTTGNTSQQDVTSQTSYWLRELYESRTSLLDLSSANIYASNFVWKNKDPKKKTSIIINNSYDLELFEVWDTISVVNTTLQISNLQIKKIDYSIDKIKIELDEFDTIGKELL